MERSHLAVIIFIIAIIAAGCTQVTDPVVGTWKDETTGNEIVCSPGGTLVLKVPTPFGDRADIPGKWVRKDGDNLEISFMLGESPISSIVKVANDTVRFTIPPITYTRVGGTGFPDSMTEAVGPETNISTERVGSPPETPGPLPAMTASDEQEPANTTSDRIPPGRYSSPAYNFSIDFPPAWTVQEFSPRGAGEVVKFISPPIDRCNTERTECEEISATFSVAIDTEPSPPEIERYYVSAIARMENIRESSKAASYEVLDKPAYRMDYTLYDDKGVSVSRNTKVFTKIRGTVYIFTFTAPWPKLQEESMYESYSGVVEDMIRSFVR